MAYSNYYLSTKGIISQGKVQKKKYRKKAKKRLFRSISKRLVEQYKKGDENRALRIVTNPKTGWAN